MVGGDNVDRYSRELFVQKGGESTGDIVISGGKESAASQEIFFLEGAKMAGNTRHAGLKDTTARSLNPAELTDGVLCSPATKILDSSNGGGQQGQKWCEHA